MSSSPLHESFRSGGCNLVLGHFVILSFPASLITLLPDVTEWILLNLYNTMSHWYLHPKLQIGDPLLLFISTFVLSNLPNPAVDAEVTFVKHVRYIWSCYLRNGYLAQVCGNGENVCEEERNR